jgi:hypothetical protein
MTRKSRLKVYSDIGRVLIKKHRNLPENFSIVLIKKSVDSVLTHIIASDGNGHRDTVVINDSMANEHRVKRIMEGFIIRYIMKQELPYLFDEKYGLIPFKDKENEDD